MANTRNTKNTIKVKTSDGLYADLKNREANLKKLEQKIEAIEKEARKAIIAYNDQAEADKLYAEAEKLDDEKAKIWMDIHAIVRELNSRPSYKFKKEKDPNGYFYKKYKDSQDPSVNIELKAEYSDCREIGDIAPRDLSLYAYPPKTKVGGKNKGTDVGRYALQYTVPVNDIMSETKKATILFKTDIEKGHVRHEKLIAEVRCSEIMQELIGDDAATCIYATRPRFPGEAKLQLPDQTGDNIMVGSVYYPGYTNVKDLYIKLYEIARLEPPKERPKAVKSGAGVLLNKHGKVAKPWHTSEGERLQNMWSEMYWKHVKYENLRAFKQPIPQNLIDNEERIQHVCKHLEIDEITEKVNTTRMFKKIFANGLLSDDKKSCRFEGFSRVTVASLITGDFDVHFGNYVVVEQVDDKGDLHLILKKIDNGGAMKNIELDASGSLHPYSTGRHIVGFGPTNHFRDYPLLLRLNMDFANELIRQGNTSLHESIQSKFPRTAAYNGPLPLIKYINRFSEGSVLNRLNVGKVVSKDPIIPKDIQKEVHDLVSKLLDLQKTIALVKKNIAASSGEKHKTLTAKLTEKTEKLAEIHARLSALHSTVTAIGMKKEAEILASRQKGAKRYAMEIKLSLCFVYDTVNKQFVVDDTQCKLDDVIQELLAEDKVNKNNHNENMLRDGKCKFRGKIIRTYTTDKTTGAVINNDKVAKLDDSAFKLVSDTAMLNTLVKARVEALLGPKTKKQRSKSEADIEHIDYISQVPSSAQALFFAHSYDAAARKARKDRSQIVADKTRSLYFSEWSKVFSNGENLETAIKDAIASRVGREDADDAEVVASIEGITLRATPVFIESSSKFRLNEVTINNEKIHWVERRDAKKSKMVSEMRGSNSLMDPITTIAKDIIALFPDRALDIQDVKKQFAEYVKINCPNDSIGQDLIKGFLADKLKITEKVDESAKSLYDKYEKRTLVWFPHGNEGKVFPLPSAEMVSLCIRVLNGFLSSRGPEPSVPFSLTYVKEPYFIWAMELVVAARNKYVGKENQLEFHNKSTYQKIPKPKDSFVEAFISYVGKDKGEVQEQLKDLIKSDEFLKVPVTVQPGTKVSN